MKKNRVINICFLLILSVTASCNRQLDWQSDKEVLFQEETLVIRDVIRNPLEIDSIVSSHGYSECTCLNISTQEKKTEIANGIKSCVDTTDGNTLVIISGGDDIDSLKNIRFRSIFFGQKNGIKIRFIFKYSGLARSVDQITLPDFHMIINGIRLP